MMDKDIAEMLEQMDGISLEDMESVRLMNRTDSKYLSDTDTLPDIIEDAKCEGYKVFVSAGDRIVKYRSLYFDTPQMKMYLDHHDRRLVRQKVRIRRYENTGDTFIEVKNKDNHGRTKKKRRPVGELSSDLNRLDTETLEWFSGRSRFDAEELSPSVEVTFDRITLVDKNYSERLTIDSDVRYRNRRTETAAELGKVVIIELKQDARKKSAMKGTLLNHRVKMAKFSKYCVGVAMTDSQVKRNRFLEKIRSVDKINRNERIIQRHTDA